MSCKYCKESTSNPKFCSRSCAAKYNNVNYPKRQMTKRCKNCQDLIPKNRTYCNRCFGTRVSCWNEKTKAEVKAEGNANFNGRYPYIRQLSRKLYMNSTKPKECFKCGYNLHYEICHIKDIKSFDDNTKITEINHLDNLVALCRNHHWEFDNGFLII